jgi:N-acetylglucosaminyldiphosphoundecaprenol N-acetyl-beta-D-mannosaminyltransferase
MSNLATNPVLDDRDASDGLDRNVFGVLGLPVDSISFHEAVSRIDDAVSTRSPLYVSTPNVNFLVCSLKDEAFRNSLLASDLCPPDGMPLIWIARLLNIPIESRVAGSDLFEALKKRDARKQLKVFLFGGAEGVARDVAQSINAQSGGLRCVGDLNPGFVSIEEMSRDEVISEINRSGADFLCVFLSAAKAQTWLMRNYDRLFPPVRVQLGATINFEAGRVRRAPAAIRRWGLEWLWRIKEEPYLWRRYQQDGFALLGVFATSVIPIAVWQLWLSVRRRHPQLRIVADDAAQQVTLRLDGDAVALFADDGIAAFRAALATNKHIQIDTSKMRSLDHRYLGLFLLVRKKLAQNGLRLTFSSVSTTTRMYFRLNRFDYLIAG